MSNVDHVHPVPPLASTAIQQLEQLEAMFHAIRSELESDCYAYHLANLGQEIASSYVAAMDKVVQMEVHHV